MFRKSYRPDWYDVPGVCRGASWRLVAVRRVAWILNKTRTESKRENRKVVISLTLYLVSNILCADHYPLPVLEGTPGKWKIIILCIDLKS